MDVCAATVALMLSGSITLQLHNALLSRSIYRGQCLGYSEPKTGDWEGRRGDGLSVHCH